MPSQTTTVREYMTPHPHSIGRDQKLATAHEMMRRHGIRHLPVLEGGRILGLVSLRDLHLVETLPDVDPAKVTVEEAMAQDPYVVPPSTLLVDLARTMAEHKYGSAIVAEGAHVIGVFTTVDALRALADCLVRT